MSVVILDNKLSIAYLNINGLRNKIDDISQMLTLHQIHVFALSETKLGSDVGDNKLNIEGYHLFRKDRNTCRGGGGAALYVQSQIPAEIPADKQHAITTNGIDIIWVQIDMPPGKPVLVGCCYKPPPVKLVDLDKICKEIKEVSCKNKDIFLLGDFNIDWLSNSILKKKIASVLSDQGLIQIMTLPTKVTTKRLTCIDHIYTNVPELCSNLTSTVTGCSDHNLLTLSVDRTVQYRTNQIGHLAKTNRAVCLNGNKRRTEKTHDAVTPHLVNREGPFTFLRVDAAIVVTVLFSLSFPGTDKMDVAKHQVNSICHIINKCVESKKYFPAQWKKNAEDSRPVSWLPFLSRIMEKIMLEQIQQYFVKNKLFHKDQFAYRPEPGSSARTALEQITDRWYRDLEENKLVAAVSLDLSSAFSLISDDLLLEKLKCCGFSDSALCLMRSYLFCRKQTVYFNGSCSALTNNNHGSIQSACLSPLLLCILTNNLPHVLNHSSIFMYEDVVIVYYSDHRPCGLISVLEDELQAVSDWGHKNNMVLKMDLMIIGNRKRKSKCPRLSVEGCELKQVDQIRLLGAKLTDELRCYYKYKGEDISSGVAPKRMRKC